MPMLMTPHMLAVVHKPADRPAVAASLNRDLARIQELCNHWCMILNPSKTKAPVVSICRSRTAKPPILSVVSIVASPNLDNLGVTFNSRPTFQDHVRAMGSRVSQRIGILKVVKRVFVDTSVLFRYYYAFVLPILEYILLNILLNIIFTFRALGVFGGQALS